MKGMQMSIEPGIAYEPVGIVSYGKKAHSCCGCCCDVRRAVIIVDILILLGRLLLVWSFETMLQAGSANVGDDTTEGVFHNHVEVPTAEAVAVIVRSLVGVLCAALSLYGAITYNKYMVAANAIFLVSTVPFEGLFVIVNLLYLYPHAFLIYYIHTGVITNQNYDNEKQSCCCV